MYTIVFMSELNSSLEEEQTKVQKQPALEDSQPTKNEFATDSPAEPDESDEESDEDNAEPELASPSRLSRLKSWYLSHKKKTIPATVLVLLAILLGIPTTRYAILGTVLKKDYVVAVIDSKSNLPVSEVEIHYKGRTAVTTPDGKARLRHVPVGPGNLTAIKKYYSDFNGIATVPLQSKTDFKVSLNPTGRQVPLKAINKINGQPVKGAVLKVADTQVKTDDKGEATVVLPPDKETLDGVLTSPGFNDQKVTVKVSQLAVKENTYQLVPAGKIYFLSKRTGKVNVMKSDLDGSNSVVVLEATGTESETDTILLASRDWQYLALKARRTGSNAKLYLIDASSDKLTEVDGADNANVDLVGWAGHQLIYQVHRTNLQLWDNKQNALKTYNAETKQLATIDETAGEGTSNTDYAEAEIQGATILSDRVTYNIIWYAGYMSAARLNGKKHAIMSAKPDGSSKQALKEFDANTVSYLNAVHAEAGEIYYRVFSGSTTSFYTYKSGKVDVDTQMTDEKFNTPYPTFLVSPTGDNTFWYESRDGKNTLFVGDGNGQKGNQIATLSEYTPYGWFSDDYVLVSKNSSELYILPSNGPGTTGQILKITDYHKPTTSFSGYGYGYGGF